MELENDYRLLECQDFDGHTMPSEFASVKQQISSFEARNSDVWVVSYPKSGTTWCQEMVWLLGSDLDYEGAKKDLELRFPYLEARGCQAAIAQFINDNRIDSRFGDIGRVDVVDVLGKYPGRRFIKTHVPWNLLPDQIKNGDKTPKIILIMREPKQVVASYYSFFTQVVPIYKGNLENLIDLFMQKKLPFGNYFDTVLSYWEQRHLPNVLILSYEEMRRDTINIIKKVSQFLGKSYGDEEICKLADHLNYDQMKSNVAVNKQKFIKNDKLQFMRKGTTDSYKQELTEGMIAKLDVWIRKNTNGTGLPYEIVEKF